MISIVPSPLVDVEKLDSWESIVADKNIFVRHTSFFDVNLLRHLRYVDACGNTAEFDINKYVCSDLGNNVLWQMKKTEFEDTYIIESLTEDGWLSCKPKGRLPQIGAQINADYLKRLHLEQEGIDDPYVNRFKVHANTGYEIYPNQRPEGLGPPVYVQFGSAGDWIVKSHGEVWIVPKKLFHAAYTVKTYK